MERNLPLQDNLFAVAEKYDGIQQRLEAYTRCKEQTAMMIDDARVFLVKPLRVQ